VIDSATHDLTVPGDILRPFPASEDVFVADQLGLARHLHPLVSVDLSAANPAWSGWAHILSPLEPYGLPGENGARFHSDYARTNALIFRLEGDRYRFLGDPRVFLLESPWSEVPAELHDTYDEFAEGYAVAEAWYQRAAAAYARNGRLYSLDGAGAIKPGQEDNPQELVDQIGGTTPFGNWTVGFAMPFEPPVGSDGKEPKAVWPLSPAGNRFELAAMGPGYPYRADGADSILLFFEPVERLVLLTFDWT
jgi:hypothetical protein